MYYDVNWLDWRILFQCIGMQIGAWFVVSDARHRSEQKPELPVVRLGYTFVTHEAVSMSLAEPDPVDLQSFHVDVPAENEWNIQWNWMELDGSVSHCRTAITEIHSCAAP